MIKPPNNIKIDLEKDPRTHSFRRGDYSQDYRSYQGSKQIHISDKIGRKYSITFDIWDWSAYDPKNNNPVSVHASVQFNTGRMCFNAEILDCKSYRLSTVIRFFEKIWKSFNCKYYER